MYSNTVTLIGFLGGDPDRRQTKNNNTFTVLSMATKASWKNKQSGKWESRTEWHRGIVFGPLADFAATLKKGAHLTPWKRMRLAVRTRTESWTPSARNVCPAASRGSRRVETPGGQGKRSLKTKTPAAPVQRPCHPASPQISSAASDCLASTLQIQTVQRA